ncbi:SDR family NAD(P)-dependent oxidoreductase [Nocardioides immobilis]|uniref:SDR family NAD(P)-dependent oxidoreductase n=1 Tax=Nocardioides immobilis TaxID=2049295 RepID=UPI00319E44EA
MPRAWPSGSSQGRNTWVDVHSLITRLCSSQHPRRCRSPTGSTITPGSGPRSSSRRPCGAASLRPGCPRSRTCCPCVNFFGAVAVAHAFAPVLASNGGGALLNVLSVLSWIGVGDGYSATKAALWSATNTQRIQLAENGTLVTALYVGYTDTPMTAGLDVPKNAPDDVVSQAYTGLLAGDYEVLADDLSRQVKRALAGPVEQGAAYRTRRGFPLALR